MDAREAHDSPCRLRKRLVRLIFGRRPAWAMLRSVVLALVAAAVFGRLLLPVRVRGDSMLPTYRSGRFNLVYTRAYAGRRTPRRGDIVAVRLAGPSVMYVKRVIGLPGETVAFDAGRVRIGGQWLDEPYVRTRRRPWQSEPVTLEADQYFLVGDNRDTDQAAHVMGRVRRERLVGRLVFQAKGG